MSRAKIDKNGPAIAKPGYSVETAALQNMMFAPQFVAARVFRQVTLTPVPFSGYLDIAYYRATYSYGKTFATPPMVLVCGVDGSRRQVSAMTGYTIPVNPGTAYVLPIYEVVSTTTGFELYRLYKGPGSSDPFPGPTIPTNWLCTILQNSFTG